MVIAPACAYDCKVGCALLQSQAHVGARGGRSTQDAVSQQHEAAPLFVPQLNRLHEEFLVWGGDASKCCCCCHPGIE